MQLRAHQSAPDFTVTDVLGFRFRLSDYTGKRILLNFNRYAGCPFCGSYFRELVFRSGEYMEKGLEIISFFQSTKEVIFQSADKRNVPFPIIADPERKIYDLYGVSSSVSSVLKSVTAVPKFVEIVVGEKIPQGPIDGDFFLMPANFLIGPPELTIYTAHYAQTLTDQLSTSEIQKFVDDVLE